MARERSLLERLRDPEPESARTLRQNTDRLVQSVLANLGRLLNARHGITPIQADYGIPDLCEVVHNFPDAIGEMRKAIKASIEKYEPRLRRVNVKHVTAPDDPFALRFEITAELATSEEKASVWIETRIDGSGQVDLKS